MAREKKFHKVFNAWYELNKQLYTESEKYIKGALKKLGVTELELNEDCNCCVTYDGGRHPEYDATPYSRVTRVFFSNGKLKLETEDVCGYDIEFISADELCGLAFAVEETISLDYE